MVTRLDILITTFKFLTLLQFLRLWRYGNFERNRIECFRYTHMSGTTVAYSMYIRQGTLHFGQE